MNRHLKILEYALASLLRRRYKNLAILAVYTLTVTLLASTLFLTGALTLGALCTVTYGQGTHGQGTPGQGEAGVRRQLANRSTRGIGTTDQIKGICAPYIKAAQLTSNRLNASPRKQATMPLRNSREHS